MSTVHVNFDTVHAAFPRCRIDGVAEYYTPKARWTQRFEEEPPCSPERTVEDQVLLALLAGPTTVSLNLIETGTRRAFQEHFSMRELVN